MDIKKKTNQIHHIDKSHYNLIPSHSILLKSHQVIPVTSHCDHLMKSHVNPIKTPMNSHPSPCAMGHLLQCHQRSVPGGLTDLQDTLVALWMENIR